MKIRLSKWAIRDLRDVRSYIAIDNPKAAQHVIARINQTIALMGERPNIGRPTSEHSTREWSVPGLPYIIPYRVSDGVVEIMRVYHTSRLRPATWQ